MRVIKCENYTQFIEVIRLMTIEGMAFKADADSMVIHVKGA